ncbi:MAG: cupin-like domain-containing protein [Acidobacteriota bacterium]|nr:cupin-like domain-containing protein [Acidobacteriota bacterium]
MKAEIEHREKLSYEEFARDYLYANKPVVITDALKGWKAVERWSPEFFKREFGTMKFSLPEKAQGKSEYKSHGKGANEVEYTMESFIDRVLGSTEENPAPYFRNQILYDLFPTLKQDIQPLPEYFEPNWLPDRYLVKYVGEVLNRGAALEIYIGGQGGAFPVLHYDGAGAHAFLMQVYGRKKFIIYPPSQEKFLYPSPEKENLSLINSVDNPDLMKFPLFAQAEPTVFILEPGEMLFIPSHWWHTTKMLTPSISISANVVNQSNWHELVTFVSMRRRNPLISFASRVYLTGAGAKRSWRDRRWRKRVLAS